MSCLRKSGLDVPVVEETKFLGICDVRITFKCRIGLAEGFPVILRTIVQTFFIEVRLLILDTKDCQDLRLVDFIVRLVLARMIRRFSILAGVGHVFTFRVAFLLLRMEFMHSSFSQTGSRFLIAVCF